MSCMCLYLFMYAHIFFSLFPCDLPENCNIYEFCSSVCAMIFLTQMICIDLNFDLWIIDKFDSYKIISMLQINITANVLQFWLCLKYLSFFIRVKVFSKLTSFSYKASIILFQLRTENSDLTIIIMLIFF